MKINWLYIGIGAVVLYLLWKKFSKPSGDNGSVAFVETKAETIVANPEVQSDLSQGDMFNELALASGSTILPQEPLYAGSVPCFCNGNFIGYTSTSNCRKMCKKSAKYEL